MLLNDLPGVSVGHASVGDLLALKDLLRELPEGTRGMIVRAIAHHIAQRDDPMVRRLVEQSREAPRFRPPARVDGEW